MSDQQVFDQLLAEPVAVVCRKRWKLRPIKRWRDTWERRPDGWLVRTNCRIHSRWRPGDSGPNFDAPSANHDLGTLWSEFGRTLGFAPHEPDAFGAFLARRPDGSLIGSSPTRGVAIAAVFREAGALGLMPGRVRCVDDDEVIDMFDEVTKASMPDEPAPEADNPEPVRHRFPRLSRERETELIDDAQHGNMGAAWEVVQSHAGLQWTIARREHSRSKCDPDALPVQDLFEIAQQEFFDRITRFDPGYGTPFGNYAAIRATNAVKRHIKRSRNVVKTVPIGEPVSDGVTLADGADQREWIGGCLDDERLAEIEPALARLSPQEQKVIRMRYGLDGDPLSAEGVAAQLQMTAQGVRDSECRAVRKMKAAVGAISPQT
jgi:RNA polymerase sigma factor (sigma-70 family)